MKVISIIKYVFSVIGLVLLIGTLFFYQRKQTFLQNADVAEGTVIKKHKYRSSKSFQYSPVVLFTTKKGEQIEFISSLSSNMSIYHKGDKVKIFYDANDPYNAEINGFLALWLAPLIVGVFGIVFFSIGFSIFLTGYLRRKKKEYLLSNGKPIMTTFSQVVLNTGLKANGESPFQIHSQWFDPHNNELYVFKSYNIWFDPTKFIKTENIKVFIEPGKTKKYYMDISFLPQMGN